MSNSLGLNRYSSNVEIAKTMQPKLFMDKEGAKTKKEKETIIKIISPDEVSVPINTRLFTVAHFVIGALYIAFSVIVFYFGNLKLRPDLYIEKNTIIGNFTVTHLISQESDLAKILASEKVGFPITWLVGILFAISGLSNWLSISLLRKYYFFYLTKCKSPTRWIEYFITSGLSMSILSYTLGVDTLFLLLSLSLLVSIGTSFGYWTETIARPLDQEKWSLPLRTRSVPWLLGAIPMTLSMIYLIVHFYTSSISSKTGNGHLYAILWSQFFLYPSFGNILAFQQFAKPSHYQRVELAYQVLVLITRFLLGSLLFAYVLRKPTWDAQF